MKFDIEELLVLDTRKEEDMYKVQYFLKKLKPFRKYENAEKDIPIEKLEKMIEMLSRKYSISIQYITPSILKDEMLWWSASIRKDTNFEWLGTIYGCNIYEIFAKAVLFMAYNVKIKKVEIRGE